MVYLALHYSMRDPLTHLTLWGFPGGSDDKESTCQCRRPRFHPWVWKIPWRRARQPTPVFLPGEFRGQRSLAGYSPQDRKESDVTGHACFLACVVALVCHPARRKTVGALLLGPLTHTFKHQLTCHSAHSCTQRLRTQSGYCFISIILLLSPSFWKQFPLPPEDTQRLRINLLRIIEHLIPL